MTVATRPVHVLFLWPGTDGAAAGNFGVPQLVLLATYLRDKTGAQVDIRDLVAERALGPVRLARLLDGEDGRGYDIIAFSVYSSFDHLKCHALAELARERNPEAVIVAGGYHASARPTSFVRDGSPFDVCVVGEGERPMAKVVESVAGGAPLRHTILGPDAIDDLAELPPTDWSYLARYRGVARKVASQAQIYLSRGCPFDCAFCMERAKREVSWRPLPVERAVEEMKLLHEFLDLRGWTLYVADALFGMKKSWRRQFLEELARLDLPIEKIWLLIRVDLVEDEDLELFGAANCGLGFGLESGDPAQLAVIRKAGRLDEYLDRMMHVSEWARERDVPWGANIICGHPGETPSSMERSAAFMRELFLGPKGTTGFLSVDPFRLYPGSPIDADRGAWEARFGTQFHRPEWWEDGDPEFLSEWVDPSSELDWATREAMQAELFGPILAGIGERFVYRGGARDYFMRAIDEQTTFVDARHRMHYLDRYYAWQRYLGFGSRADEERRSHKALRDVAMVGRSAVLPTVKKRALLEETAATSGRDASVSERILDALVRVPREQFVPVESIGESVRDIAIASNEEGTATVSAMHAYARAFSLLDVGPGDRVLDLGAGTGYGSALLRELVGGAGAVIAVEIDPALSRAAAANLVGSGVAWATGDALDPTCWPMSASECTKVYFGFAIEALPAAVVDALPTGARIVAPIATERGRQSLTRITLGENRARTAETFEDVWYVARRGIPRPERDAPTATSVRGGATNGARKLPIVSD